MTALTESNGVLQSVGLTMERAVQYGAALSRLHTDDAEGCCALCQCIAPRTGCSGSCQNDRCGADTGRVLGGCYASKTGLHVRGCKHSSAQRSTQRCNPGDLIKNVSHSTGSNSLCLCATAHRHADTVQ